MKTEKKTFRVFGPATALVACLSLASASGAQLAKSVSFKPLPMKFGDTSRTGADRPFAKDPTVIRHQGRYLMYYSVKGYDKKACPKGFTPNEWASAIAESTDLVHWKRLGDVRFLTAKGPVPVVAPCVKKFDGRIHIFGQAPAAKGERAVIWHGTSEDGLTFTCADDGPMFAPENPWSLKRAIDAEVYRVGDRMVLLFATRESPGGKVQQLGLADAPYGSSYAAGSWQEHTKAGPLLKPDRPWEMNCLEAATVIHRKGVYYLFYAGAYNHERQQIGLAYSMDGYHYQRFSDAPVLAHGEEGTWNAWESGHPGVFEDDDGRLYLFYQGKATLEGDYALSCAEILFDDGSETLPDLIHGAPREQPRATLLWTRKIWGAKGVYVGWPTVCRRQGGELVVAFSGDRAAHVCPWGKDQIVRSTDGGETWSRPVTVHNGTMDDRDAGIMELRDGTLVLTWFSSYYYMTLPKLPADWKRHFEKTSYEAKCRDTGYFTSRSTDGGLTWEEPVRTLGSANHGGIPLKSGRLMMVGRYHHGEGNLVPGNTNDVRLALGRHALTVETSDDGAKTWHLLSTIKPQLPYQLNQFHEPHLVERSDGTIVAQFRYHGGRHRTLQSESKDGGRTWSDIHETGLYGFPSHLIELKDGRLLSTYGCREKGRYGERAALSSDGGATWDVANEILLAAHTDGDLGYPSTVQLEDGSLLTVYYQPFKAGEKPSIMATKWRVK